MQAVWDIAMDLGGLIGIIFAALVLAYSFPHSPLRRWFETWIERRLATRFEKDLETFRHQLAIDAETVRADYQRRLHDSSLYAVKKHEVFRELFRLILVADGAVGQLSGGRIVSTYEDYSADDIRSFMESAGFTGTSKQYVLGRWESDKKAAIEEVNKAMRRIELARADEAVGEAWNYFLVNSLYLDDSLSHMIAGVFKNLKANLAHVMFPDRASAGEQIRLKQEASELIEQLKRALREQLESATVLPTVPKRPSA